MSLERRQEYLDLNFWDESAWMGSFSPNHNYMIAWVYGDPDDAPRRKYALFCKNKMSYRGETKDPLTARVSNNGTFILSSGCSFSERHHGILIMNSDSKVLYETSVSGFGGDPGISLDGKFACWSQEYKVVFYDILNKKIIWKQQPRTGSDVEEYDFDISQKTITFHYDQYGSLKYSFDGTFLDAKSFYEARLKEGLLIYFDDMVELIRVAQSETEKQSIAKFLFQTLSVKWKEADSDGLRSSYTKMLGEMFEVLGMADKAIESYQKAVLLNPHIGVKGKIKQLQKSKETSRS